MAGATDRFGPLVVGLVVTFVFVGVGLWALPQEATSQSTPGESDLEIVSMDVPETMEPGKRYTVSATVRNTGDSAAQVRFGYIFRGEYAVFNTVIVPAGEQQDKQFSVTLSDVVDANTALTDGVYEHGWRAGTEQLTREVTVRNLATPTATGTPLDSESVAEAGRVSVLESTVPDRIPVEGRARVSALVANDGAELATVEVVFRVEGGATVGETVRIEPGQRRDVELAFDARRLRSGDAELVPGNVYTWQLTAAGDDAGSESAVTGEFRFGDEGSADTGGGEGESERSRGFFSNTGDEPDALTNAFNLTVLGFLLSVLGILYQMLGPN